jgi:hypothetical protein
MIIHTTLELEALIVARLPMTLSGILLYMTIQPKSSRRP